MIYFLFKLLLFPLKYTLLIVSSDNDTSTDSFLIRFLPTACRTQASIVVKATCPHAFAKHSAHPFPFLPV